MDTQEQAGSIDAIEELIDNTIIARLKENNIFNGIISVEEVRFLLLSKIKNVAYKDLSNKGLGGEWDLGVQTIYLDKNKIDERLIIHELLHALTTAYLKANSVNCGIQYDENRYNEGELIECFESGRGLNEGLTEYLAQQLCPVSTYQYSLLGIKFPSSSGYALEEIMIKQLAILYDERRIKIAYINCSQASMRFLLTEPIYDELTTNFDHILEQETAVRNKFQGRSIQMLSTEEKESVFAAVKNVQTTFIESQQFFLENCLQSMIDRVSTLEEAEQLALKIRQLNMTGLTIEGNEKANYEMYNFIFARKYLQIINQDRAYDEQVRFDDVEQYLIGDTKIGELPHEPLQKEGTHSNTEFIGIDRGEDGTLYIRKRGKEIVGGWELDALECFTEEQYREYIEGKENVQGTILRGVVHFDIFTADEKYRQAVINGLFSQEYLEDRIKNHNGYIGHIGHNGKECVSVANADVEKRLVGDKNTHVEEHVSSSPQIPADEKKSRIKAASIGR